MASAQWLDDHGYQHIHCHRCGWSGWTDGGCEGCPSPEVCDHCGEEESDCTCWSCDDCGEKTDDDERHCSKCGEGRSYQTLSRSTVQVARKTYGTPGYATTINPGDKYKRTVTGGYKVDGPRWLTVSRKLLVRKVVPT